MDKKSLTRTFTLDESVQLRPFFQKDALLIYKAVKVQFRASPDIPSLGHPRIFPGKCGRIRSTISGKCKFVVRGNLGDLF